MSITKAQMEQYINEMAAEFAANLGVSNFEACKMAVKHFEDICKRDGIIVVAC